MYPVETLRLYEKNSELRDSETKLFISIPLPRTLVTSSTIASWMMLLLEMVGVDTIVSKADAVGGDL